MQQAKKGDLVRVHYTGRLTDGSQFDSSTGRSPLEFTVGGGQMIRGFDDKIPIIFLTARSQTEDVVKGFVSGGNDYLRKPFSMEELIARIENQLRIYTKNKPLSNIHADEIKLGKCIFYPNKFELHTKTGINKLSHREAQILSIFSEHINDVIDRRMLLQKVWGDDTFFNSRNLDVYIRKIREYFSLNPEIEIITLKGKGYHFLANNNSY